MRETHSANGGATLSGTEAQQLRKLIRSLGPRRAVELTGIPETTLARLAAEMEVRRATAIVARQAIARLPTEGASR